MSTFSRLQRPRWQQRALMALCALLLLASIGFGLRTYVSFQLMQSAYAAGLPGVSSLRGWMTLRYVATTYRASETVLIARLGLASATDPDTTLKTIAERNDVAPLDYVQRTQRVVAELAPALAESRESTSTSWLGAFGDQFLAALLLYGYPALGLTLFLGALGVPLPAGLLAAVTGSLAAQGKLDWFWASTLAITASVLGDVVGYGLGRLVSVKFLNRWGHWVGYTLKNQSKVEGMFQRHGVLTLLLSRPLVSYLSSVVNLLAGVIRYQLPAFLILTVMGRLLWTCAYMGLGYVVGGDLDAATRFLQNLAGLLISSALLVAAALKLQQR
ncbi:MAG: DedA family protein [Gammaproteobacteria bacterium]|uniref:DedA family protein n=1 Tax=Rhodoferax sp. TaxID=50421 RepID=UPI001840AED9|nr:DedA family protein [Rhodoferax sp.]MBU3900209.1 DedA family protein [Gammaproteobacteria bacterium]MBA3058789.1 DedA family protein [Rhodoferax sp.]MBU3999533.1 DedA family protein [Gammaproteobacteria bacterium]MBU4082273.1 DedA family protein [Gammaproteobacteria bacterium]MBU4113101.1 DedA family protein [Gammaproteobacteria bacterium]